jgi:hypothetical protein
VRGAASTDHQGGAQCRSRTAAEVQVNREAAMSVGLSLLHEPIEYDMAQDMLPG